MLELSGNRGSFDGKRTEGYDFQVRASETKAKDNKLQKLKRRLDFENMFVVDCNGRSGGLCLFWKKNIKVDVIYSDNNVIHFFVTLLNANLSFHYSLVYGNPIRQQKKLF